MLNPGRPAIASDTARCTEADLGCPCAGDAAAHAAHAGRAAAAPTEADGMVECPECGEPSSPRRIAAWGHCRACRTADSRSVRPLRW